MTVVGILQAFVVGWLYGTSIGIEIYFAAITFYQAMLNLLQTGQIAEVFTPMYHRLKQSHGDAAAQRLFSMLVNWMVTIAILLAALAFTLASMIVPILVPGFSDQNTHSCIQMFCWVVPLAFVQVCLSLITCFLAAEKRFVGPEITRLVSMTLGLITIVIASRWLGAWAMVAGLWVTNIVSVMCLIGLARRAGYQHRFRFSDPEVKISPLFRSLPSIFSYVFVTQLYSIALTSGLSTLPQGSLAVFSYARRIFSRINGLLVRPISVVFFNHYSADLIDRPEKTRVLIRKSLRLALLAVTFACAIVTASGYPGLKMLWLSEQFFSPRRLVDLPDSRGALLNGILRCTRNHLPQNQHDASVHYAAVSVALPGANCVLRTGVLFDRALWALGCGYHCAHQSILYGAGVGNAFADQSAKRVCALRSPRRG